jgi:hypothetical protein
LFEGKAISTPTQLIENSGVGRDPTGVPRQEWQKCVARQPFAPLDGQATIKHDARASHPQRATVIFNFSRFGSKAKIPRSSRSCGAVFPQLLRRTTLPFAPILITCGTSKDKTLALAWPARSFLRRT